MLLVIHLQRLCPLSHGQSSWHRLQHCSPLQSLLSSHLSKALVFPLPGDLDVALSEHPAVHYALYLQQCIQKCLPALSLLETHQQFLWCSFGPKAQIVLITCHLTPGSLQTMGLDSFASSSCQSELGTRKRCRCASFPKCTKPSGS